MSLFNVNIINPPLPEEDLNPIAFAAINQDNTYDYYRFPSLDKTNVDLGLEDAIRNIDVHQVTKQVYAVDELGVVWRWDSDGSNVETVLATGFTDVFGISIDSVNDYIVLAGHYITAATGYTVRFYEIGTGNLVHSYFTNVIAFPNLKFADIYANSTTEKVYANITRAGLGTGSVWEMRYDNGAITRYTAETYTFSYDIVYDVEDDLIYTYDGALLVTREPGAYATLQTVVKVMSFDPYFIDIYKDPDTGDKYAICSHSLVPTMQLINLSTTAATNVISADDTARGLASFERPYTSPTVADAGTIFFTVSESTNTLATENSVCRRDPDGTITVLSTHATEPRDISVDEENRRIYYSIDDTIRSCKYDGSNDIEVYAHGTGDALGIAYMPSGTAAGYIYWIYEDTSGNRRVRRVFRDGTGSGQVSTGTFQGGRGIRRYSNSLLYCDGNYITTAIFSVGITPTNTPTAVSSHSGFNSSLGIAIDTVNDAVFVQSGAGGAVALRKFDPPSSGTDVEFARIIATFGGYMNYDLANQRILMPGVGLRYVTTADPSTLVDVSPAANGSDGTSTGVYYVNSAYAIQ